MKMNKWAGIGRLTGEPNVKYSQGDNPIAIADYTLACDRKFKREGEPTADFIRCKAFGKSAEFVEKYLHKGMKIAVVGRIQTGSFEKDGVRHYTTDIIVEEHEFCESKSAEGSAAPTATSNDGFMNIPDGIDEELPFR